MQGPEGNARERHRRAAYDAPPRSDGYAPVQPPVQQQVPYSGYSQQYSGPGQAWPCAPSYPPMQQGMPVQGGYQRQPRSAAPNQYQSGMSQQGYQQAPQPPYYPGNQSRQGYQPPPPMQGQPINQSYPGNGSMQNGYQRHHRSAPPANQVYSGASPVQDAYQREPRSLAPAAMPQEAPHQNVPQEPQPVQRQAKPKRLQLTSQTRKLILFLCSAACVLIMLFSGLQIVSYYGDYFSSEQGSDMLREAYYEVDEEPTPTSAPATPTPTPTPTMAPEDTPVPSPTPRVKLEAVTYPDNPFATVRSRFKKIQRQNEDIIGWLTIDGVLDEAVVQRDNSYYLTRDYRGYHNSNGALFLEEEIDLATRPYTLMIYGHNMKTGAMFGSLRNYEHLYFYKENPFITFDTAYEDGRYIIVAVGNISTDVKNWTFVNFASLLSNRVDQRQTALKALLNRSIFGHNIEVTVDDQLLVLLTCVGDETERRVVVARRIRPEESEEDLHRLVYRSWEKQQ